jgi:hypothetical protein
MNRPWARNGDSDLNCELRTWPGYLTDFAGSRYLMHHDAIKVTVPIFESLQDHHNDHG